MCWRGGSLSICRIEKRQPEHQQEKRQPDHLQERRQPEHPWERRQPEHVLERRQPKEYLQERRQPEHLLERRQPEHLQERKQPEEYLQERRQPEEYLQERRQPEYVLERTWPKCVLEMGQPEHMVERRQLEPWERRQPKKKPEEKEFELMLYTQPHDQQKRLDKFVKLRIALIAEWNYGVLLLIWIKPEVWLYVLRRLNSDCLFRTMTRKKNRGLATEEGDLRRG